MPRPSKAKQEADIVSEAKEFYGLREGAETENRRDFTEDLRFAYVPGAQWDANAKVARQGRPCYSYNRTVGAINQLVGDMRMIQPSCKVRAINKKTATATAEIMGGLIRDIEAASNAPAIYAESFKYAVAGAWGCWRIVPEWADDDDNPFQQVLRIKRIPNPLMVYFDNQADPFGRGAMRCVVADRIAVDEYKALYGDAWTNIPVARDSKGWFTDQEVRIAEYYRMEARTKKVALLSDGRVEELTPTLKDELARLSTATGQEVRIERDRTIKQWYCRWVKIDGAQVLEGPIEYQYRNIPVIRLPGRHVNIEGKEHFQSLIRHAKDPARTYNYNRSNMVETVALTPRAPWTVTAKMIKDYEEQWARANVSNAPYLVYDIDPDAPEARPTRSGGPEVPQAYIALAAHDAEDIRQTTGYMNPALDQQTAAGDAESGRALRTRMMAGDSGSYEFLDNLAKAIQFTWDCSMDMVPVHYDTERIERIFGTDGRESFEELNPKALRDGRFDVTVTLGPAYATARMEALDTLLESTERMPIIAELAPDIIVKNLDVQGASEIEQRIRIRLVQQGVIPATEEDQEALADLPEQQPDPVQTALAARLDAQRQRDMANAQKVQVETAKGMVEAEAAERREQLELANMVADLVLKRVEAMLGQRELVAPREKAA